MKGTCFLFLVYWAVLSWKGTGAFINDFLCVGIMLWWFCLPSVDVLISAGKAPGTPLAKVSVVYVIQWWFKDVPWGKAITVTFRHGYLDWSHWMSQDLLSPLLLGKTLMKNLLEFPFKCASASIILYVVVFFLLLQGLHYRHTRLSTMSISFPHFGSLYLSRNFASLSRFPLA